MSINMCQICRVNNTAISLSIFSDYQDRINRIRVRSVCDNKLEFHIWETNLANDSHNALFTWSCQVSKHYIDNNTQ